MERKTSSVKRRVLLIVLLGSLLTTSTSAIPKTKSAGGFLDFNAYYDTEQFSVFTLNLLSKLHNRIQYFSLTNYYNALDSDTLADLDQFYSEQNLRWALPGNIPFDLTIQ